MSSAWDGLANTQAITQLPHYAVNKRMPEDSFYTQRSVAKNCVETFLHICKRNKISLRSHTFVEPSAGEGCFYDVLPSNHAKLGLDINPGRHPDIAQADFLTWWPSSASDKFVVIGNPPFGVRGAIALAFVKRAFLFADIVAFILPMSFYSNGKGSNMKRVQALKPNGSKLLHSERLESNSFYVQDIQDMASVNTVFQVWKKGRANSIFCDYNVSDYAEIYTCCSSPDRYCGLGRGRKYDCFISSTFYRDVSVVNTFEDVLYGSGYGIIIKRNKRQIMKLLKSTDWLQYCSDATNHCKHIRMFHIRKLLGEHGYGTKI